MEFKLPTSDEKFFTRLPKIRPYAEAYNNPPAKPVYHQFEELVTYYKQNGATVVEEDQSHALFKYSKTFDHNRWKQNWYHLVLGYAAIWLWHFITRERFIKVTVVGPVVDVEKSYPSAMKACGAVGVGILLLLLVIGIMNIRISINFSPLLPIGVTNTIKLITNTFQQADHKVRKLIPGTTTLEYTIISAVEAEHEGGGESEGEAKPVEIAMVIDIPEVWSKYEIEETIWEIINEHKKKGFLKVNIDIKYHRFVNQLIPYASIKYETGGSFNTIKYNEWSLDFYEEFAKLRRQGKLPPLPPLVIPAKEGADHKPVKKKHGGGH